MASVEAVLLGTAQDAGLPQAGCRCSRCAQARADRSRLRYPVSLALVDHQEAGYWLIDTTPAITSQLDFLFRQFPNHQLKGIFLTHAHAGHYPGLLQFGKEAWNTAGLSLYASERMLHFLSSNEPWRELMRDNVRGIRVRPGESIDLSPGLKITAFDVPHRAEFTDTLAYRAAGERAALAYCPDIDSWDGMEDSGLFSGTAFALVDGTFYSPEELPGRDLRTIPHPFVQDTIRQMGGQAGRKIWFIHLNHSNPLHDDGPERRLVEQAGFGVAAQWQSWRLG